MPGGYSGLFPGVIESRKKREEERQKQLKEYTKVAFTDAQEERIREIVKEELPKFVIDSDCGEMIVENRLQQLKEKECKDILNDVSAKYTNRGNRSKGQEPCHR